jgi:hypothetical protein
MPSNELTALEIVSAFGTIATPILLLVLSGIGWFIANRMEKQAEQEKLRFERQREQERYLRELEEKLRDDRIEVYNQMLEPFIIALMTDEMFDSVSANERALRNKTKLEAAKHIMFSLSYRKNSFKLALMGSDSVVSAYNELTQFFYRQPQVSNSDNIGTKMKQEDNIQIMHILGTLLLEIRKSVGNENTTLDNLQMLEWMITDIRKHR